MIAHKTRINQSLKATGKIRLRLIAYVFFWIFLIAGGLYNEELRSILKIFPDIQKLPLTTIGYWIAVLLFIAAIVRQFNQLLYAQQLDQEGIPTSGTITNCRASHGADYTDFILTYAYLTNQRADAEVPSKIYHSAREGDQVQVFYLPNHPKISRLDLSSIPERPESPIAMRPTPMRDKRSPRE
jgi:hypothetical protein